ncbi:MAG: TerB family tellurite resistance protein [Myxococcota bacterium]
MTKPTLQPTTYALRQYNITAPIDFDVAVNYGVALMAIAGADGELADNELQWFLDEQKLLLVESEEYIAALRAADWRNIDLEEVLSKIHYDFPLNVRRAMLYQAIKMCRADKNFHEKEKRTVRRAAEILGVEAMVLASIESVIDLEESTARLRLALLETGE